MHPQRETLWGRVRVCVSEAKKREKMMRNETGKKTE